MTTMLDEHVTPVGLPLGLTAAPRPAHPPTQTQTRTTLTRTLTLLLGLTDGGLLTATTLLAHGHAAMHASDSEIRSRTLLVRTEMAPSHSLYRRTRAPDGASLHMEVGVVKCVVM